MKLYRNSRQVHPKWHVFTGVDGDIVRSLCGQDFPTTGWQHDKPEFLPTYAEYNDAEHSEILCTNCVQKLYANKLIKIIVK